MAAVVEEVKPAVLTRSEAMRLAQTNARKVICQYGIDACVLTEDENPRTTYRRLIRAEYERLERKHPIIG